MSKNAASSKKQREKDREKDKDIATSQINNPVYVKSPTIVCQYD
jgi:hypothetical protein